MNFIKKLIPQKIKDELFNEGVEYAGQQLADTYHWLNMSFPLTAFTLKEIGESLKEYKWYDSNKLRNKLYEKYDSIYNSNK